MEFGFDLASTSIDSARFLIRPERMTADYLDSLNLHMEPLPPECNCPPPPNLNWRPPPDPSLIFGDLFEDEDFRELRSECQMDFPSVIPVDLIPKEFEPIREYLAFLISAILAMMLVLIGAGICCVYMRRSGRCRSMFKSGGSEKCSGHMSSTETSVLGLSSATQRKDVIEQNGRFPGPDDTLRETKWSYNSMRPNPVRKLTDGNPLHQASSLGLLMYGDEPAVSLPYSQEPQNQSRYIPSSQTLPRKPRELVPSKSLPAPFQQPNATAAFSVAHQRNFQPISKPVQPPVYEEIRDCSKITIECENYNIEN